MLSKELMYAAGGTGCTWLATVLGASLVLCVRGELPRRTQKLFLGFAAGVMTAAAVWSLLLPAAALAEARGGPALLPVTGGFLLGCAGLMLLDGLLPHLHLGSDRPEGLPAQWRRTTKLLLAVTLHNIPEGMAVGLSFAAAAQTETGSALAAAGVLAVGMGIQNFPEGAAVTLPLRSLGLSRGRAFLWGTLSGAVEPAFGLLAVLAAGGLAGAMPWMLAFAAGAMLYVVVEEMIPEAQLGEHSHAGTISVLAGFLLMLALDTALA